MISIQTVVWVVLFLIGCAAIFGLLMYVVRYVEKEFPDWTLFCKFARIFLVVAGVFVLIGLIMHMMGNPLVRWQ